MVVRLDWFSFYIIISKYYVNKRLLEKQHQAEGLAFINILNNNNNVWLNCDHSVICSQQGWLQHRWEEAGHR